MTNFSVSAFDIPTALRSSIGIDRMLNDLTRSFANGRVDATYPPYNIIKLDEVSYALELAIAGFGKNDIDIEVKDGVLQITGKQTKDETVKEKEFLHKGISARAFSRTFTLADKVEVDTATMENGMLTIVLKTIVPEEKKAKKIKIGY